MKNIFKGAGISVIGILIGVYLLLISGALPVATKGPPLPFEGWVTRQVLNAAQRDHTNAEPSISADEINLIAGAKTYLTNCAVCHGTPEQKATAIAKGLFPQPPQFFEKDEGVSDDAVGKIFWFIKNGVRLTGMPGFVDTLSENEIWQLSLFLKNGEQLSTAVRETLLKKSN